MEKNRLKAAGRIKKDELLKMLLHTVDTMILSMKTADQLSEYNARSFNLALYALYLKPLKPLLQELPEWNDVENLLRSAEIYLTKYGMECPCEKCETDKSSH